VVAHFEKLVHFVFHHLAGAYQKLAQPHTAGGVGVDTDGNEGVAKIPVVAAH